VCDECKDEYDEPLLEINGRDYCRDCAIRLFGESEIEE
jgi:hypothetical protein